MDTRVSGTSRLISLCLGTHSFSTQLIIKKHIFMQISVYFKVLIGAKEQFVNFVLSDWSLWSLETDSGGAPDTDPSERLAA